MSLKLFDLKGGVIVPSDHCYNLATLKDIIEGFPEEHIAVFSYLFYMTCPDPKYNPFTDYVEHEKEDAILEQLQITFSTEDELVQNGLAFCKKVYNTPTLRAYTGIKHMLDKLADYMETTEITHGRDGNLTAIVNAAAKFDQVRQSFKGAYEDLKKEQKTAVRGHQKLAYDQ